ncbi:unnamed protein product [Prorocentrum cordatum]|uniref:NAD(P)H-hydrate epimerase n=2 Tax=Prorocentrum cordatum TaxID=2364126 RepID=A0ABN9V4V9_9DINO|nr:unnamed protein product [Polarella glacialis]
MPTNASRGQSYQRRLAGVALLMLAMPVAGRWLPSLARAFLSRVAAPATMSRAAAPACQASAEAAGGTSARAGLELPEPGAGHSGGCGPDVGRGCVLHRPADGARGAERGLRLGEGDVPGGVAPVRAHRQRPWQQRRRRPGGGQAPAPLRLPAQSGVPQDGEAGPRLIAGNELYRRLTLQLAQLSVPVVSEWTPPAAGEADVIVDAIFGFSFKGWRGGGKDHPDAPFDEIVRFLSAEGQDVPVVSVDIPSGWDVEAGPPDSDALRPEMLVSLTAPKLCARLFQGRFHYLGEAASCRRTSRRRTSWSCRDTPVRSSASAWLRLDLVDCAWCTAPQAHPSCFGRAPVGGPCRGRAPWTARLRPGW